MVGKRTGSWGSWHRSVPAMVWHHELHEAVDLFLGKVCGMTMIGITYVDTPDGVDAWKLCTWEF